MKYDDGLDAYRAAFIDDGDPSLVEGDKEHAGPLGRYGPVYGLLPGFRKGDDHRLGLALGPAGYLLPLPPLLPAVAACLRPARKSAERSLTFTTGRHTMHPE